MNLLTSTHSFRGQSNHEKFEKFSRSIRNSRNVSVKISKNLSIKSLCLFIILFECESSPLMKRKCDTNYCVTCCGERIHSFLPIDYYQLNTFPFFPKLIRTSEGVGFTDTQTNPVPPERPIPPIPVS